jgi:putative CocE/NonD family hydrolase
VTLDESGFWTAPLPEPRFPEYTVETEIFVPMRDGTNLSTDVYLPVGAPTPLATVLLRTPYDKDLGEGAVRTKWVEFFVQQGYAAVVQNERGFFFSEGTFLNYLQGASTDGPDTIDWIVAQPWSNGRVGTMGCSSSAEQQWPMAAANTPGHAAMIPSASGSAVGNIPGNDTRGAFYRGGIPMLSGWAKWYGRLAVSERPVLVPDTTQAERQRMRKFYAMSARKGYQPDDPERLLHLPSKDVLSHSGGPRTAFDHYMTRTPADPAWDDVEHIRAGARPRVPALHLNTWHDFAVVETVRLFEYLQNLGTPHQHLIIGAGPHCVMWQEPPYQFTKARAKELVTGMTTTEIEAMPAPDMRSLSFGDLTAGDVRYRGVDHGYPKLFLAWFENWLKGEDSDITAMPSVQLYVMNRGWITSDVWPPREAEARTYHLGPDPAARLRNEAGGLTNVPPTEDGAGVYVYDPMNPTPSVGGGCCGFDVARDQRVVSARRDVLVYGTPPLEEPVSVVGPVTVTLNVSTSAADTDLIVRLVDVHPDGTAINIADDGFRLRYRDGFDRPASATPGRVYAITLTNLVAGNRFGVGHRIRLEISSSSFPVYERNLNTGGNNYDEVEGVVAENTVRYGPTTPSSMTVLVVPEPEDA